MGECPVLAGNVMLTALAAWRASAGSRGAAAIVAVLMLVSVDQLYVHAMAWTEPSFIFFSLAALLCIARYIEGGRRSALVGAVVGSGFALLDRYIGAAVVLTIASAIVLWGRGGVFARLSRSVLVAAIGATPLVVWVMRNQALAGNATSRALAPNALLPGQMLLVLDGLAGWIVPATAPVVAKTLALLGIVAFICVVAWRGLRAQVGELEAGAMVRVTALYVAAYLAVMAISITFSDPPPVPVDFRYMAPLYPPALIAAVGLARAAWRRGTGSVGLRRAAVLLFALLAVIGLSRSLPWLAARYSDGLGYASQVWRQSEVIGLVRGLPPGARLFSNASDAIYALTGRPGYPLPPASSYETGEPNAGFVVQMEMVRSEMTASGGFIVYCRGASRRTNLPSEETLVTILDLEVVAEASDGAIYRLSP